MKNLRQIREMKNNKKNIYRCIAIAMFVIAGSIFLCFSLYASDVERVVLEKNQDQNASALYGKTILTGSGLSVEFMTNLKKIEEARIGYILKREEIQKERLTNNKLKCS